MEAKDRITFGEWLSDQLQARGLKQGEFADMLDAAPSSVSAWVNDDVKPTRRSVRNIASALDIDLAVAMTAAGYPVRVGSHTLNGEPIDDVSVDEFMDAADAVTANDESRIYASMVEGLTAMDLDPVDRAAIKRMIDYARAEAQRRRETGNT